MTRSGAKQSMLPLHCSYDLHPRLKDMRKSQEHCSSVIWSSRCRLRKPGRDTFKRFYNTTPATAHHNSPDNRSIKHNLKENNEDDLVKSTPALAAARVEADRWTADARVDRVTGFPNPQWSLICSVRHQKTPSPSKYLERLWSHVPLFSRLATSGGIKLCVAIFLFLTLENGRLLPWHFLLSIRRHEAALQTQRWGVSPCFILYLAGTWPTWLQRWPAARRACSAWTWGARRCRAACRRSRSRWFLARWPWAQTA